MCYLLIEALQRIDHFYGGELEVEFPANSGKKMNLADVANELNSRLVKIFLPNKESGARPCNGNNEMFAKDPHWKNLVLFHEYFHGDTGKGLGAR